MSKITLATIKSFVKKESTNDNLYIKMKSSFDGMVDCVMDIKDDFHKANPTENNLKYTLGFRGVWVVGGSRDYFTAFENDSFVGYEVYNSCGSFILAKHK